MTLIEIMVAVIMGGIILTAVYINFLAQYRSYTTQSLVTEMQQNARVAMDALSREIRMAGFGITGYAQINGAKWKPFQLARDSAAGCPPTPCTPTTSPPCGSWLILAYRDPASVVVGVSGGNFTIGTGGSGINLSYGTIVFLQDSAFGNGGFFVNNSSCISCTTQISLYGNPNCYYSDIPDLGAFNAGNAMLVRYGYFFTQMTGSQPYLMFWDGTFKDSITGGKQIVRPVASGIESIGYQFLDKDNNSTENPDDVRKAVVTLTARTSRPDPGTMQYLTRKISVVVLVRNMYSSSPNVDPSYYKK